MEKQSDIWNSGYVTDLEYTHGFYRELEPGYLCYAALISGYLPPDTDSKFTYCELGCGNALSTNIIASAWPQGDFYGIDFNPSHIVNGALLSKSAGLTNLKLMEADFRDLVDAHDLPEFDFITVHGVLSWVNAENRKAIQRFVLKKLKPGGILYLSYNCLPGWAAAMPVRELMKRFADDTYGSTLDKVNAAINSVEKAFAVKSGFFNTNTVAESRFDQIKIADKHYLAHEYFNRDWQPFYFSDIMSEFSNAKVSFIGSAELFDHYVALYSTENARQMISEAGDEVMKETLKDYFLNRGFRKDIFMRGTNRLTVREQTAKINDLQFALSVPGSSVSLAMKFSFGEAKGKEEIYQPVIDALSEKPMTLGEISTRPLLAKEHPSNIIQAVTMLVASGQVGPAETRGNNRKSVARMNQAILKRSMYGTEIGFMVSPLLRTGVSVYWINQLLLNATHQKLKTDDYVWDILQSLGQRMKKEGKIIQNPEENKAEIRLKQAEFLKTDLPYLKLIEVAPV